MLAGITQNTGHKDLAGSTIDRYTLIGKIGAGGMGSVWRAKQEEPVQREVALKLIKLGMDSRELVARFEAERQMLALLDHPNIAQIFDAGTTESGRPYYVMELVDGVPVTDYCKEHQLSVDERLSLFCKICDALRHAHEKGIVHLDLKPSNILVVSHTRSHLKVIDFGIAKAAGPDFTEHTLTTDGHIAGTPGYMSPEQADGAAGIDLRADIYSLGALLYELLSGSPPFTREMLAEAGLLEVIRIIKEEEPPRPSTRRTKAGAPVWEPSLDFSSDLDWIALKALAKKPEERYQNTAELVDDIGRHLRDEPITAHAPWIGTRLKKFARRRRGLVIGTAAMIFAVIVTFLATSTLRQNSTPVWTVDSLSDSGAGSLRQKIADAPPRSVINFSPDLAGQTITLTSGQIIIDKDITISAISLADQLKATTGIQIDAGGEARHFLIQRKDANVELSGLRLTSGRALEKVTTAKQDNTGGSIHSLGFLTLIRCIFSGNRAYEAGAVYAGPGSQIDTVDCILEANAAVFRGGGIGANTGAAITIRRSTFSENTAHTGAAIAARHKCHLENTTITGNHAEGIGGVQVTGKSTVTLLNSIIAANPSWNREWPDFHWERTADIKDFGGNLVGNPLVDNASLKALIVTTLGGTDPATIPPPLVDPMLAPLGDYGGFVPTMPPLAGSPAIDLGVPHERSSVTDARRAPRAIDGDADGTQRNDVGAVELQHSDKAVFELPESETVIVTNTSDSGAGSLRESIAAAPAGAIIQFAPDLAGKNITLETGELIIDKSLTIDASGIAGKELTAITIDGGEKSRIIHARGPLSIVTLRGISLTRGLATPVGVKNLRSGGCVFSTCGKLILQRCILSKGKAYHGGALCTAEAGRLRMERCIVSGNHSEGHTLYLGSSGSSDILDCAIIDNRSDTHGAGLYVFEGYSTIRNCTIAGNYIDSSSLPKGQRPPHFGGIGISKSSSSILEMTHCTIVDNHAPDNEALAGVWVSYTSRVFLQNNIIAGNTAAGKPSNIRRWGNDEKIRSRGGNFIGNNYYIENEFSPGRPNENGDHVGSFESPIDPNLARLGESDSPVPVMTPLPDSPVIDIGTTSDSVPAVDPLGTPRPQGAKPDSGAVELRN